MNLQEMRLVIKHAPGSLPLRVVNNLGQICRVIGMRYDPLTLNDGFIFDIDSREEVLDGNVVDAETEGWARRVSNDARVCQWMNRRPGGLKTEQHPPKDYHLSVETPNGNYLTLSVAGIWEEGPAGGPKTEVPANEVVPKLTGALMRLSGIKEADPDCPACGVNTRPPATCPPPGPIKPVPDQACGNPTCSVSAADFDEELADFDEELADKLVDLTYDLFHALKAQLKSKLPNDPGLRERFLVGGKLTLLIPDQI